MKSHYKAISSQHKRGKRKDEEEKFFDAFSTSYTSELFISLFPWHQMEKRIKGNNFYMHGCSKKAFSPLPKVNDVKERKTPA